MAIFFNKNNVLSYSLIMFATCLSIITVSAWSAQLVHPAAPSQTADKVEPPSKDKPPSTLRKPEVSSNLVYFSELQGTDVKDSNIIYTFEIVLSDNNGKNKKILKLKPGYQQYKK